MLIHVLQHASFEENKERVKTILDLQSALNQLSCKVNSSVEVMKEPNSWSLIDNKSMYMSLCVYLYEVVFQF